MLAKAVVPSFLVLLQAMGLGLMIHVAMHIPTPHVLGFLGMLAIASLTFLSIVMTLIWLLGDAGRLVALIFLVFQLGAAGGTAPIELSNRVFRTASPFLPMTNVVKGLRAVLFDSYSTGWLGFAGGTLLAALFALSVSYLLGRWRWRYVSTETYGPLVEG